MHDKELPHPPIAAEREDAVEVLRVWAVPDGGQQVMLNTVWPDPAAWGLVLVDIANHAANAYAAQGIPRELTLSRILALFNAEWESPTDVAAPLSRQ